MIKKEILCPTEEDLTFFISETSENSEGCYEEDNIKIVNGKVNFVPYHSKN